MGDAISALCVQANVLQDDRIKAQHHHFIEACHDLDAKFDQKASSQDHRMARRESSPTQYLQSKPHFALC